MRLFGADSDAILAECTECGRVLRIQRMYVTRMDQALGNGYSVPRIDCKCGNTATVVLENAPPGPPRSRADTRSTLDAPVRCPKCGSSETHAEKRGWRITTGFIGSSKIYITCLRCGKRFKPGEGG